jgi:hypothetical protein
MRTLVSKLVIELAFGFVVLVSFVVNRIRRARHEREVFKRELARYPQFNWKGWE